MGFRVCLAVASLSLLTFTAALAADNPASSAPVWERNCSTLPYVNFVAGEPGVIDLAGYVANAKSLAWKSPERPAWLRIEGMTLVADGTQTAGIAKVVLTAVGASPADSPAFPIGVSPPGGAAPGVASPFHKASGLCFGAGVPETQELAISNAVRVETVPPLPWLHFLRTGHKIWMARTDGTQPVGETASVVLRATGPGGVTADSPPFPLVVHPTRINRDIVDATMEFDYAKPIWCLTDRAGATIYGPGPAFGPLVGSKHTTGVFRPADGRVYFGWGDSGGPPVSARDPVDGMTDKQGMQSANPAFVSFDPGKPTTVRREFGKRYADTADSDDKIWVPADEGPVLYDSVRDRLLVVPLDSFASQWGKPTADIPIFVDGNAWKTLGDKRVEYPVRQALRIAIRHKVGGAPLWVRGRVASSTFDGTHTVMRMNWWDTGTTFQDPVTVVKAKPGSNGGRQEMAAERYDDATQTWYTTLAAWDFTTKEYSSLRFSTNTTSDPRKYSGAAQVQNAVFCPPAMTGRGAEIHAFHPAWGKVRVWDFADMNFKTFPGYENNCGSQHWPCSDGERFVYYWDYLKSRLVRWDVRQRAIATWVLAIDGKPVTGDRAAAYLNSRGGGDHTWFEWNEELKAIEFYVARTELWLDLFLIDVSGTPTIRHIASADQNGLPLRSNNPIKVPPYKGKPQRTLLTGGVSFDLVRTPSPDKFRVLVVSRYRPPAGTP